MMSRKNSLFRRLKLHRLKRSVKRAASHPWMDKLTRFRDAAKRMAYHSWFENLARFGYAAKGIVYFIVGLLAAQVALTTGGKIADTSGVLVIIVRQPFGRFLLAIIAIGLIGYVLWRIVQTIFDPDHSGEEMRVKQIVRRMGYGFSAIAYSGLALTAVEIIMDTEDLSGSAIQTWTTRFMAHLLGRCLVGLAGLVMIAVGTSYLYQAYSASFQHHFKYDQMTKAEWQWAKILGQFGLAARGTIFGMIGLFLALAALHSNARTARGLAGVLSTLERQLFGSWLLGTVAFGLIAYSIYCLIEARYRRVTQP